MRYFFLLNCVLGLLTASASSYGQSQIDFDKREAIYQWIGSDESSAQYYGFDSYFEDGEAISTQRFLAASKNWKVVRLANYAFGRSFPVQYKDVVWTQQPLTVKRIPSGGYYFLENLSDPSQRMVLGTWGIVFFDTRDEKSIANAKSLIAELKDFDNAKALYRSGVVELNDKGKLQFLDGVEKLKYDWQDIILDEKTRAGVQGSIDGFLQNYDWEEWKRLGVPLSRGVLLDGPPGTGKSMVAKIIMSRTLQKAYPTKPTFIYVSARHVYSKYSVRAIYHVARKLAPSVVFIEDVDLIAGTNRTNKQDIKNELMQQLSGVEALDGVLTVATTNYGKDLDEALTRSRRLGFKYTIGLPGHAERLALFKLFLKGGDAQTVDLNVLASRSEGMTGADIRELCRIAFERALRTGSKSNKQIILSDEHLVYAFEFRKGTKKGGSK